MHNNRTIVLGVILLIIASQLSISAKPVPYTFQSLAVLMIGLSFKPYPAIVSTLLYLLLGAIGLPVFANFSGGLGIITGLSGGYLLGFLVAVFVMSNLTLQLSRTFWHYALNIGIGSSIILACGVFRLGCSLGFSRALEVGFYPFLVPATIKAILALAMLWAWPQLRRVQCLA